MQKIQRGEAAEGETMALCLQSAVSLLASVLIPRAGKTKTQGRCLGSQDIGSSPCRNSCLSWNNCQAIISLRAFDYLGLPTSKRNPHPTAKCVRAGVPTELYWLDTRSAGVPVDLDTTKPSKAWKYHST